MIAYEVNIGATSNLFASAERAIQSIRLSYHKLAKVVPNAVQTQVSVIFDKDGHKVIIPIISREIMDRVEHL